MARSIPTLEQVVSAVAAAADREGFTPGGLLDYLRDMDAHPEAYGPDIFREQIEERLFGGTGVCAEDVSPTVCRLATVFHREQMKAMIRRWQAEADARGVPVTYILEGDAELGWEARLGDAQEPRPAKATPAKVQAAVRTLLGVPVADIVTWMASKGWDESDMRAAFEFYGGDLGDALDEVDDSDFKDFPQAVKDKLEETL